MEEDQYSFRARTQYMETIWITQHAEWYRHQIPALEANGIDWLAKRYRERVQILLAEAKTQEETADQMIGLAAQSHEQALKEKMLYEATQMKELEEGLRNMPLQVEEEVEEVVQPTDWQHNQEMDCIDPQQDLKKNPETTTDTIKTSLLQPIGIQTEATVHLIGQPETEVEREQLEMTVHPISRHQSKCWVPLPQWNEVVYQNSITEWMTEGTIFPNTETPPMTPTEDQEDRSDASIVDLQATLPENAI